MHLFYCPALTTGPAELPEDEAHHARAVLRSRVGDRIGLVDGRGTRAEAEITAIDKHQVAWRILSQGTVGAERKAFTHLGVALTKQVERFEWMLEKCTEIGVDRITPLLTERTERDRFRRDRLERVLISAMKQSQRAWLPQLDEPTALHELEGLDLRGLRCFGWCEGENPSFLNLYSGTGDVVLLIGPEGDFTAEEADRLRRLAFQPASLGLARLRTETAAVLACAWMSAAQQV